MVQSLAQRIGKTALKNHSKTKQNIAKWTLALLLNFIGYNGIAQTIFWQDSFENATTPDVAAGSSRTPSINSGNALPSNSYFKRSNNTSGDIALNAPFGTTYQAMVGSYIWAGCNQNDINGTNSVSEVQTLEWTNINISGRTNISFKGLFAANNTSAVWDNGVNTGGSDPPGATGSNDFILIEYAIDAGAYTKLLVLLGDNIFAVQGKKLKEDTDNDGIGDGPELNIALSEIVKSIPGTGSTLKIRLTADVNGTNEEWAIDNFRLTSGSALTPTTTSLVSNLNPSTFGQNVTFTATVSPNTATGTVTFKDGATTLGSGTISSGVATFSTTSLSIATHTITAEYGGDGSNAASTSSPLSQVVNCATPGAYSVTGGGSYCSGGTGVTVGLADSETGVNYQLKNGSNTVGSAVAGTGVAISFGLKTAAGTYTVEAIAATGGCNAVMTGSVSITITTPPSATISYSGSPFCTTASSVAVTQTGTGGGTYSANPSGLTLNPTTGQITPSSSTAGTYTVTYTIAASGGCAQVTATANVTITAAPSANISYSGSPFCTTASPVNVTQTGTGGGTYSVNPSGLTLNPTTGQITPSSSAAGTYTIIYTIAASGGCAQVTATAAVTITAAPSAAISYTGSPFCTTESAVNVTQTGTSGGTYSANPVGLTLNPTTGQITPSSSMAGTYTVMYTIAASGGCAQVTVTSNVTITTAPSATISYLGTPFCATASAVNVTQAGTGGGTYSSGPSGLTLNPTTGQITPSSSTAGTYTVMYTIAASGGCAQVAATANVTLTTAPSASISYSGSPYCSNATTAPVSQTGTVGGSYSSTVGLIINNSTGTIDLTASMAGTYSVTYSIEATGGCAAFSVAANVTITAAPAATISYTGSPYKKVGTALVTLNGTPGGSFSAPPGLSLHPTTGTIDLAASSLGFYTVTYTIAASGGCARIQATAQVQIQTQLIYVNAVNASSSQDGASWTTAFASLTSALSLAAAAPIGTIEVWVAQGTYHPGTLRKDVFEIPSSVKVFGGFIGTENSLDQRNWKTHLTVLSGEIGAGGRTDNSHHVVLFRATDDSTRLDGFQIERGYAEFYAGNQNTNLNDPDILTSGGGILAIDKSKGHIINCTLTDNRAMTGAGILLRDSSTIHIAQSIIFGNEANFGGGVYILAGSKPHFENVLIANNKGVGGGLYVNASQAALINCTIASNQGTGSTPGGIFNANAVTMAKNIILWGNSAPQSTIESPITYSIVEGGYPGVGNSNRDPLFVNPNPLGLAPMGVLGDYHLQACSPAINAGNNNAPTIDLDGNARPSLVGLSIVDMGAYESQATGTNGPEQLNVTDNITGEEVLKTGAFITATNQISNATVVYQATRSVTLLPGFSATGNSFRAVPGDCPTSVVTSQNSAK